MNFINDGSEELLHENIRISLRIKCDVCGHSLKTKGSDSSIRVLPCCNCVHHHSKTHADWIADAEKRHETVLDKRQAILDKERKALEVSIYKKFEARFAELMKDNLK